MPINVILIKLKMCQQEAVSMGIGSIMKGKKMILMAYGEAKADAIQWYDKRASFN
jgi:6-phosphogluconolactonase/glucosamine-6-phosphate isomerase/deaminase